MYNDGTFTMKGGNIIGNTATIHGGGVCVVAQPFNLSGGTISENKAASDGGGVYVYYGPFNVSGTPVIKGNTLSDGTTANNVSLQDDSALSVVAVLHLVDELTGGEIWITKVGSSNLSPGEKFGEATASGNGAEHFVADVKGADPLVGSISGTDLI